MKRQNSSKPSAVAEPTAKYLAEHMKLGQGRFEPIRSIRVRGAKEHNLKSVNVEIPRDRLVVITGLSGSGKSSLAFDTIFAEGQRKYMESLSAYARQFLDQLKKPAVESIEGLPPTIAIEQRSSGHNPRSTVATSTEIYDYLRLLFARIGTATCWHPTKQKRDGTIVSRCGKPIAQASATQIVDHVAALPEKTKLLVLAPVIRDKKGYHREALENLYKQGVIRARVNGQTVLLEEVLQDKSDNPLKLGRYEKHNIEGVIDRLVVKAQMGQRLGDSIETALKLSGGVVLISREKSKDSWEDTIYSEHLSCSDHPECALEEKEPRMFSFNSHYGACPTCHGLGALLEFDEELVLPDPKKTLSKGGIAPWKRSGPAGMFAGRYIRRFCRDFCISRGTEIGKLDPELKEILLHGTTEAQAGAWGAHWEGVIPLLDDWFQRTESQWAKDFMHSFMTDRVCSDCHGARLNIMALSVFVPLRAKLPPQTLETRQIHALSDDAKQLNIADFASLNIETALKVCESMKLSAEQKVVAEPIVKEIQSRLGFLASVGLNYLSMDRKTNTLSGGEAQRIRLATQVGSGIVGAAYVLDEPTIGLHARDNSRLIRTLRHLADIGNTVIVVEHDEEMIRAADQVIDIGPGPGVHGGQVIAQGTIEDIEKVPQSLTGAYLSGRKSLPKRSAKDRRPMSMKRALTVKGARANNLKGVDVGVPLGGMVCVTGVSGSGKSTLVNDILLKAVKKHLNKSKVKPGLHTRVNGLNQLQRVIEVDQSPIGRTPRSNPATYTGIFDDIRTIFAQLPEAKLRGYKPGRFSFNVKGGRCEACQGQGLKKIAMHFLPDVHVTCEICHGARYNRETLQIKYRDKSIADVLDMTSEVAAEFFAPHKKIHRMTKCLVDVGLGYIRLGQTSTTLSGGEAQRVKLATELGKGTSGHTLYVLDEPTTGLHFEDVRKLIGVVDRLVDQENTMVLIEHNLDVTRAADWVIDLGPEGGDGGGTIVAQGTPEKVAKAQGSYTGRYLRE